jgi:flagellar motor protein MotB
MLREILVLPFLVVLAANAAEAPAKQATKPPAKSAPKKKAPPKPTNTELMRQLQEQRALIDAQQKLIEDQAAKLATQESKIGEQDAETEAQKQRLVGLQEQLEAMTRRLDEIQQEIPAPQDQQALEERLKRIEAAANETPDIPPNVVSAGDFPGSIRIPGTDAAIKFGGRIRFAAVFTLAPLGSDDRFLTNSIPVELTDEAAGEGARTSFSANTSRFSFELRTPTGAGQLRTYIEGDFYGSNYADQQINFRMRQAYAQFHGVLVGQTWSTFSDPAAAPLDMDFEGINSENVVRQPQVRYTAQVQDNLSVAGAAETPAVSITGGKGVNQVPDLVGRIVWKFRETGQLQWAVVLREIRGEPDLPLTKAGSSFGWGESLSGIVPIRGFGLLDRFVFQLNFGEGIGRYINDLSSWGGQDAAFNPVNGNLYALPTIGFYLDYEHTWKEWKFTRTMNLRSAVIYSFVTVDNFAFQPGDAYHQTNRLTGSLVFSPIERIDIGVEYLYGTRENKDGKKASADQIQLVGIFRF